MMLEEHCRAIKVNISYNLTRSILYVLIIFFNVYGIRRSIC